jgi:hypothetical protein
VQCNTYIKVGPQVHATRTSRSIGWEGVFGMVDDTNFHYEIFSNKATKMNFTSPVRPYFFPRMKKVGKKIGRCWKISTILVVGLSHLNPLGLEQ